MRRRVLVAGTFDIIHPGHIHLFREASKLGDVIVIVARDENVKRFKGREPIVGEDQRLEVVRSIRYVSEARLGNRGGDILKVVEEVQPDVILLGPDQSFDEDKIRAELAKRGIDAKVVRLPSALNCQLCSSTAIIKRVIKLYLEGEIKI